MLVNGALAANNEKVLYSFSGSPDGADPHTGLTFDSSGNAYGTSVLGGANGFGTVFELTPSSGGNWTESVLYSFAGGSDGMYPYGGVVFDKSGNLYGTTVGGGTGSSCDGGCGTVFKLSPSGSGWNESVIYSFAGGNDGFGPGGPLILDKKGNLYGTTPDGGTHSDGTVYTLVHGKNGQWTEKVIHSFAGGKDGATGSLGPLLLDKASNLYGVTETQGASGYGTAYKLSPVSGGKWKLTTLYGFKGEPDAASPYGGLVADAKGRLYGTTYYGGANGFGAVFKLTRGSNGSWTEIVLYSFQGGKDGSATTTTLLFDKTGNLYGTTSMGGDPKCDCGIVFKLAPSNGKWTESVAHRFTGTPDGANPYYGLASDKAGKLYGTTATGGDQDAGTVFELTP